MTSPTVTLSRQFACQSASDFFEVRFTLSCKRESELPQNHQPLGVWQCAMVAISASRKLHHPQSRIEMLPQ